MHILLISIIYSYGNIVRDSVNDKMYNVTTEIHIETEQDLAGPSCVQKPLRVPSFLFVEKALVS